MVAVTHFSDPGCPWAYSASPAHAVLRWRYRDQLHWRLVVIGLTEQADQYVRRGYTPAESARGYLRFRRCGMPFAHASRASACRRPAWPAARSSPPGCTRPSTSTRSSARCSSAGSRRRCVFDEPRRRSRRSTGRRPRRRRDPGALDDPDGRGGLPGRPRRGPHRRGLAHARAGQARPDGRPGPLHRAVADLRRRRPPARGRRLPARRGLRRPARQPRPGARAHAAARGPARGPRRRCPTRS